MSEITFEFNHKNIGDKIIECGVQIMIEEAEGSSSRELDSYETESSSSEDGNGDENINTTEWNSDEVDIYEKESINSEVEYNETGGDDNHLTDGDGDYEAEGFKFSEIENIKTSKRMLPETRDNSGSSPVAQVPKCKRMCIRRYGD
ncbi:unnamed protein product [Arabidopsis arenosa]|uniref:Uncharacterized protein n=1 Tax=Arabidopsis arenosa TaxID=38785 RepID=A0A8S2AYA1_ARAAE|nr:unnamed protein product [Arabidopsis arenosa]